MYSPITPLDDKYIRRIEVPGDLLAVADLIDLCFAGTMDEDGIDYLRHIRRAATNPGLVRWVPAAGELVSFPLHGFVWVEDGNIVGNLSLIPFYWQHRWRFLIANVAVHPDYRRKGIGRKLTEKAIQHARSLGHHDTWLHVRENNVPAIQLYQSLGFQERYLRATWQNNHPEHNQKKPLSVHVSTRKASDWEEQKNLLCPIYPDEVSWNLGFKTDRFKPGFLTAFSNFIHSRDIKQWIARVDQKIIGTAIWEATSQFADTIWLGTDASHQEIAVEALLETVKRWVGKKRPLAVNYPANQASIAFTNAGFQLVHNLLWMEKILR